MTVKLSRDSFIALLDKSGLVAKDALPRLVEAYRAEEPDSANEGEHFAQFLIRHGDLTTWQARKLLQGKHKGFTLGKYKLLSLLGRGGMSSVYLAEHMLMKRRCAIKVLPSKQVKDKAALTRFHQEAQAVAALDDPNIVRAYDVDQVTEGNSEIHFLVMEYVEGRSLQEVVDEDGPLPIPHAIDYICQAASGLHHAHQAGMVHRDIKPSNLLLDQTGTVKILDMGLARFFEQTDQNSLTLQYDQRVLGTADYLSPEQAVDSHRVDTRSDIYSLGGTLYFLLAGHPPFPEGSLAQRLLAHQTKQPKPVTEERSDVPASFAKILERMMSKNPNGRPQTAGDVRDELTSWLEQQGRLFPNVSVPPQSDRRTSSRAPAEPTSAGWSDLAPKSVVTPPPQTGGKSSAAGQSGNSHVISDPNLGDFLSALSTETDPSDRDSDHLAGAKTIVSKTRTKTVNTEAPAAEPAPDELLVTAESGIRGSARDSASGSRSRIRRASQRQEKLTWLAGGAGVLLLLITGWLLWPPGDAPTSGPQVGIDDSPTGVAPSPAVPGPAPNARPPVEPGKDITVGPEGNFATIREAIEYVRANHDRLNPDKVYTIRVAGGRTYAEAIEIDNSQFGTFPRGINVICDDSEPATLAPPGVEPIVTLINVERFRFAGFRLAGNGRPVAMRLEDYLSMSTFERLTIDHVVTAGVQAIGVAGLRGTKVEFRDVLIQDSAPEAVGLSFEEGDQSTKELRIHQCRFAGQLAAGIRFEGDTDDVFVTQCRFGNVATPIRFDGSGQQLEGIVIANNTFHDFEQGVAFATVPVIGQNGIGFHKNLFAAPRGPDVVVLRSGQAGNPPDILGRSGASDNWSEGTGDLPPGAVDVYLNGGRRGVEPIQFVDTNPANSNDFLKPIQPELATAAQGAVAPKFIGAVRPAGS